MDHRALTSDMESASRLAGGEGSRVLIYVAGFHYEIENVVAVGDTILLEAGGEAAAPVDPMDVAAEAEVEELERDLVDELRARDEGNDPEHLRIAEDQPAQNNFSPEVERRLRDLGTEESE